MYWTVSLYCSLDWVWQQSDVLSSFPLDCSLDWMWQQPDVLSSVIRLFTGLNVAAVRCTEQFATRLFTGLDVATVRCTEQFATRLFTGLDVATVRWLSNLPVLSPCSSCLALGPCVALFASPAPHPNNDVHHAPGEKVARAVVSQHLFNDNVVIHTFPVSRHAGSCTPHSGIKCDMSWNY